MLEGLVEGGKALFSLFEPLLGDSTATHSLSFPRRPVKMRGAGRTVIWHSPIAKDNQAYTQIAFTFQVNLVPLVLYLPT